MTFMAAAGNARSSQQVSVTRGAEYRYADYGYGTYLTYQYTVKFGNVSATAYVYSRPNRDLAQEHIQSIRLEMVKHWLKYVTMAQRLLAMMDFLQRKWLWKPECRSQIYSGTSCCVICEWQFRCFFWCKCYCTESCEKTL